MSKVKKVSSRVPGAKGTKVVGATDGSRRTKVLKWPEKKVKAYMVKLLNKSGLTWWRNQSAAGMFNGRFMKAGCPGLPDMCVLIKGSVIFYELKATGKKLSAEQLTFAGQLEPGTFFVVDSKQSVEMFVTSLLLSSVSNDVEGILYGEDASKLPSEIAAGLQGRRGLSWEATRTRLLGNIATFRASREEQGSVQDIP